MCSRIVQLLAERAGSSICYSLKATAHYRIAAVLLNPEIQWQFIRVHSDLLPDSVVGLFLQIKMTTTAIKYYLSTLVVSRINPETGIKVFFFPTDFIALPQAIDSTRMNADKSGKHTNCQRINTGLLTKG